MLMMMGLVYITTIGPYIWIGNATFSPFFFFLVMSNDTPLKLTHSLWVVLWDSAGIVTLRKRKFGTMPKKVNRNR